MNSKEKFDDDPLKNYIGPLQIEKAPEGFTAGIMRNVEAEVSMKSSAARHKQVKAVPLIFAAAFAVLGVLLFFIPGQIQDTLFPNLPDIAGKIDWTLPSIEMNSLFSYNSGNLVYYILAGIAMLTLFDRGLRFLFHNSR